MGRSFENRKHSIAKTAAQKSKVYSKYGTQLYVAAKNGVPDPEANPSLKHLIEKAKRDQVPAHVIDKAIEKAKGAGGEDFTLSRYEGYGPGGTSIIVDCLTDNPNRTITDVRNCFNKTGSKLGASGSVVCFFDHLAVLAFPGENDDEVLEAMLEEGVDVEDVECQNGRITVFAPASEFNNLSQAFKNSFPDIEPEALEVTFLGQTTVDLNGEDVETFEKLLELLEDCEDVQHVYHNARFPE